MAAHTVRRFKCRRGHRYTETNTAWRAKKSGAMVRICKTCRRENAKASYRRTRAKTLARMNDAHRRWLAKQSQLADDDEKHGTIAGYNNHRCRCEPCTAAIRDYHRRRRSELARRAEVAQLADLRPSSIRAWWSLDSIADARFGMDRINPGDEWDDPVFELVASGS